MSNTDPAEKDDCLDISGYDPAECLEESEKNDQPLQVAGKRGDENFTELFKKEPVRLSDIKLKRVITPVMKKEKLTAGVNAALINSHRIMNQQQLQSQHFSMDNSDDHHLVTTQLSSTSYKQQFSSASNVKQHLISATGENKHPNQTQAN